MFRPTMTHGAAHKGTALAVPLQVLVSFERPRRRHFRESGNPSQKSLEKEGIQEVDSRFRGNDDASEGSAQRMTPVTPYRLHTT